MNAQYFRTRLAANLDFKAEEGWGEVTFLPLGVRESKKERKSSRRNSPLSSQSILTAHQRWQLSNQVTKKANYLRIFPVRCQHRGLKISDSTLYVDARSINQRKKRHVNNSHFCCLTRPSQSLVQTPRTMMTLCLAAAVWPPLLLEA